MNSCHGAPKLAGGWRWRGRRARRRAPRGASSSRHRSRSPLTPPLRVRNLRIIAVVRSGRSIVARCAAGEITSNRAPGIRSAIRRPCSGGVDGSCSPAITRVGAAIDGRSGVQVHFRDRLAAARVALARSRGQDPPHALDHVGVEPPAKPGGEPTTEHRVGDRPHPFGAHCRRPLVPGRRRAELSRRAAQDEALDPLRGVSRDPHADHPADRQPAQRRALDPQPVQQREQIDAEVGHRVRPGGTGEDP